MWKNLRGGSKKIFLFQCDAAECPGPAPHEPCGFEPGANPSEPQLALLQKQDCVTWITIHRTVEVQALKHKAFSGP